MAVKTQGSVLYFIDPANCQPVKVACVTSLTGITAGRDQIETTCLDSAARTYEAGMATPGQAQFGINFDPSESSHIRLHDLYVAGTKIDWALGWADGTGDPTAGTACDFDLPTTRSWLVFNGYVSDCPFDFSINAVVASSVSIQISDFPELIKLTP